MERPFPLIQGAGRSKNTDFVQSKYVWEVFYVKTT